MTRLSNIKARTRAKQLAHLPLALLLLWGVIASCCSEALASSATNMANPAEPGRCNVPGAPTVLAEALCSGRSEQLQGALDSLKDTDDPPTFLDVIPMLDRVWLGDRSLGPGLPWADLTGQYVRATIVQNLAEQVRLGRSKIPLKQMQEFAVQLSRKDAPLGASEGVVLIGFTHAPDQVEFLKQVLVSSTQPGLRSAIIHTLGMLCDQEAGTLLVSLQSKSGTNVQERKWIADSLHWRSTLSERTCRMALGGRGKR